MISLIRTYLQIATVIWLFVWNQTLVSGFSASHHTSDIATSTSRSYDAPPQTNTAAPIKTKWLIVGGGIHGVHISARLLGSGVVTSVEDICIIDGHDELLQSWKSRTRGTGMEYLRSSAGYHLDSNENSLRSFDQQITASEDNSNINTKKRGKNLRGVHKDKQRRSTVIMPTLDLLIVKMTSDQTHTYLHDRTQSGTTSVSNLRFLKCNK